LLFTTPIVPIVRRSKLRRTKAGASSRTPKRGPAASEFLNELLMRDASRAAITPPSAQHQSVVSAWHAGETPELQTLTRRAFGVRNLLFSK
jgi:hypothetical protein